MQFGAPASGGKLDTRRKPDKSMRSTPTSAKAAIIAHASLMCVVAISWDRLSSHMVT
jgi:hypothetical protein